MYSERCDVLLHHVIQYVTVSNAYACVVGVVRLV